MHASSMRQCLADGSNHGANGIDFNKAGEIHCKAFNVDLVIPCLEYRRELRAAVPGREGGAGRTEGPTTTGGDEGGPDRGPDHGRKGRGGP